MNGKNIEKLVLFNRIVIVAIILTALIVGTVSHTSTPRTAESREKLDSMLASADFNTVDFTPFGNLEVPIAGDTTESTAGQDSAESNQSTESTNDAANRPDLSGLIASLDGIKGLKDALLQRQPSDQSEQTAAAASQSTSAYRRQSPGSRTTSASNNTSSTTNNAASSNTKTDTKTDTKTSTKSSQSASSSNQPQKSSGSAIDYDKIVYVDDNYEAIDSPEYTPVPSQDSGSSSDDS